MIRVAIVEDDALYQNQLADYLKQYEKESGERFQVTIFPDGNEIAYHYKADYDIILMDIELGAVNGMEAAQQIRKLDHDVVIIFITNMSQYAIQGYAVEALDYVLKPVSYYAFTQRIERAIGRMQQRRQEQYIYINTGRNSARKQACSGICYVEVQEHTLIYHTTDGNFAVPGAMREVEKKLDSRMFFRCNKGYLVNLSYVDGMRGDNALVGGDEVQVSRAKKKPFLDALNDYINEVAK